MNGALNSNHDQGGEAASLGRLGTKLMLADRIAPSGIVASFARRLGGHDERSWPWTLSIGVTPHRKGYFTFDGTPGGPPRPQPQRGAAPLSLS